MKKTKKSILFTNSEKKKWNTYGSKLMLENSTTITLTYT